MQPVLIINNHDYAALVEALNLSRNDLDAEGSGRDVQTGEMFRTRVATKLKATVKLLRLQQATMQQLLTDIAQPFYSATVVDPATGAQLDTDVDVYMDGIKHVVKPGEEILITKGNSISLAPYVGHIFGPKPGTGDIVVGEVSRVNDDNTDNYWMEATSRFSDIVEDEAILHPLCNEYDKL